MIEPTITFVTGGVACGKSIFAAKLVDAEKSVTFIATATASDAEMIQKIAAHKKARPKSWHTMEAGQESLVEKIKKVRSKAAILDCLTLFTSTRMILLGESREKIIQELERSIIAMRKHPTCNTWIIVSNEVGWGVVPEHLLGRAFRETLGAVNKIAMQHADRSFLMVSGHPLQLK